MNIRIGHGFDVHQLVLGRKCIIGGVEVPFEKGLDGHSDADVLLHAICDALLGAAGMEDIGKHFPPSDDKFKGIDSRELLRHVVALLKVKNYVVNNIDATVICEAPKLSPHTAQMCANIAAECAVDLTQINIKATTTEKLGFTGRGEGIAAEAVCTIVKN
jgi:2-C-methyl-D-erythritol 2,4-cyclodiphosphate synthase